MIQRIQTIYLLVTAILMAVTVFSPLETLADGEILSLSVFPLMNNVSSSAYLLAWAILIFSVLGSILPFFNIFLYKRRKLQLKVCTIVSIIIILFYGLLYFYSDERDSSLDLSKIHYGLILPIIAFISNILASLGIKKDEKLIRSLNRIR